MTKFKNMGWDKEYKERLGEEVFEFLTYDQNLIEYLSDHRYVWNHLKPPAHKAQLSDNAIFVLPICKLYEGTLKLVGKEAGWFDEFNNGEEPHNIRSFYRSHREHIEAKIDALSLSSDAKQDAKDRFFSVIGDFKERHKAVHSGLVMDSGSVENYDAILTKIRDLVSLCLEVQFISIGDPEFISSETGTVYRKK